jgi:hypothetical protein
LFALSCRFTSKADWPPPERPYPHGCYAPSTFSHANVAGEVG